MSRAALQPRPPERVQPARFGGYILTERLGQGGMAVVYKAKREGWHGFEKTVVVKAMLPALTVNKDFVDLFISEAKITAQLSHPGIVQVHDFGVYQGTPYLVMDYLNGINLAQLMRTLSAENQVPPWGVTVLIVTEVAKALGYAHDWRAPDGSRRQIIHSDVSPSNVMVCRDGSVKLLDFGVAKMVDAHDYDVSVTVKGKYPYMSPEQVNRLPIDRRVDVFACGIVLWELLTGKRLFAADTDLDTLKNVDGCQVPSPSRLNPAVPPQLDAVCRRALSRDPGDRYDSGTELALALENVGRIGGGRRRVAEYLASLFPNQWFVVCQVCGKQVVPGFTCIECGTQAPAEQSGRAHAPTEQVQPPVLPTPLSALPDLPPTVAEPFLLSKPRILGPGLGAQAQAAKSARRRWLPLVAAAAIGAVGGVAAVLGTRLDQMPAPTSPSASQAAAPAPAPVVAAPVEAVPVSPVVGAPVEAAPAPAPVTAAAVEPAPVAVEAAPAPVEPVPVAAARVELPAEATPSAHVGAASGRAAPLVTPAQAAPHQAAPVEPAPAAAKRPQLAKAARKKSPRVREPLHFSVDEIHLSRPLDDDDDEPMHAPKAAPGPAARVERATALARERAPEDAPARAPEAAPARAPEAATPDPEDRVKDGRLLAPLGGR